MREHRTVRPTPTSRTLAILALALAAGLPTAAAAQQQQPPSQAQQRAVAQACRGDIQKHCAGVQPGGGRIGQCLMAHATELTKPCQDALQTVAAGRNTTPN